MTERVKELSQEAQVALREAPLKTATNAESRIVVALLEMHRMVTRKKDHKMDHRDDILPIASDGVKY